MNATRNHFLRLLLGLFILLFSLPLQAQEKLPWSVYFSPKGGCTDAIIKEVNNAKISVLVQAYNFSSAPIAKALLNAYKRGVRVEVILDKGQRTLKYSSAKFFFNSGIPTRIDSIHGKNHNKIIIIDAETVITGSFNFTKAAEEQNAENVLVIRDKKLASLYTEDWEKRARHSEVYIGKAR